VLLLRCTNSSPQRPAKQPRAKGCRILRHGVETGVDANRSAACLFCGRTASLRSVTAALRLSCLECGGYEVTLRAISHLRGDPHTKGAVRAEIRRQLENGVVCPRINIEFLKVLKGRWAS
jgi:hypothetical protein